MGKTCIYQRETSPPRASEGHLSVTAVIILGLETRTLESRRKTRAVGKNANPSGEHRVECGLLGQWCEMGHLA